MNKNKESEIAIILAMHGSPPRDFPKREMAEFFDLHMKLENMPKILTEEQKNRCHELEEKMRTWPRTKENDPFYTSSNQIADLITKFTKCKTYVGFNEFCNPSIKESLTKAIKDDYKKLVVITPMMTPGGEHSEHDIPSAINTIKEKYPEVKIEYAWPFKLEEVAEFLAKQIQKHL